jgi:uncharacterized protein with FMN-binding domain
VNAALDYALAWASLVLAGVLTAVWALRFLGRGRGRAARLFRAADRWMRRHHKAVGIALLAAGLLHGRVSSAAVLSLNVGTVLWVLSLLLGLTWLLRRRLGRPRGWMTWHRVLTVAFAGALAWHVVDVGGIQGPQLLAAALRGESSPIVAATPAASQAGAATVSGPLVTETVDTTGAADDITTEAALAAAVTQASYSGMVLADGVYTGTATGYRPGLTVQVIVSGGEIAAVRVVSHSEVNARFYATPIQVVPAEIVAAQTTNVDAVSGATFTSTGIINAVNAALSQALVSGTLPADRALPQGGGHRFTGPAA